MAFLLLFFLGEIHSFGTAPAIAVGFWMVRSQGSELCFQELSGSEELGQLKVRWWGWKTGKVGEDQAAGKKLLIRVGNNNITNNIST